MTDHPLTDKDIQSIWDKIGNDIVDAKDEDLDGFVDGVYEDYLIRTAYDKGSTDMLDKVLKWLNETIFEQSLHDSVDLPEELRNAMRPQQEDC